MDNTLRFYLAITRNLPKIRGIGKLSCMIRDLYARNTRPLVNTQIGSINMTLNPNDKVEGELLFHPHLYESEEITHLIGTLQEGDNFLDAGAHLGFYSLHAAPKVGRKGKVLAVEAHPQTFKRLSENFVRNDFPQCKAVNVGLADVSGKLNMTIQSANQGANSFLVERSDNQIQIDCLPLAEVLKTQGISSIKAAKFDLEGFEFRVLKKFFEDADRSLWPRFILVEFYPDQIPLSGGNVRELLLNQGYKIAWERQPRPNLFFELTELH